MDPAALLNRMSDATSDGDLDSVIASLEDWRSWTRAGGWKPFGYAKIVNRARSFVASHTAPELGSLWQSCLLK